MNRFKILCVFCGSLMIPLLVKLSTVKSTIPNLELIAACLSVRLTQKVISELRLKVDRCFYWVDAVCVLHLIRNRSKRF